MKKLSQAEVTTRMIEIPNWRLHEGKLHREFQFRNFIEAFQFMTDCALFAEQMNHHPEWFNVYKTVRVDLHTHDVNGISEKDFMLAKAMSSLVD